MEFQFSEEREKYLQATGKIVLNACPGSGKTTAIAYKLLKLVKGWNCPGGIACLSFTNTAKSEIQNKFKIFSGAPLSFPHFNGTIDSFINRNITLPHINKLLNTNRHYRIVDEEEVFKKIFSWDFINKFREYFYKYPPYKISYRGAQEIYWNNHNMSNDSFFIKYANAAKAYQWEKGFLLSDDSLYFSLRILNEYPQLSKYLAHRYPYIILDEAQDTSESQYKIFENLIKAGLQNIELVGDPYQCLYEWRDANPDSFLNRYNDKSYLGLTFIQNRRSTQKVINAYKHLRGKADNAITSIKYSGYDLPIHVIKYDVSCAETIPMYKELYNRSGLKNNIILVRGTTHMCEIVGDKRKFNPWKNSIAYYLVNAKIKLIEGNVRDAMKICRKIYLSLITTDYHKAKELEEKIENDCEINANLFTFLRSVPDFNNSILTWTHKSQILVNAHFKLKKEIDFDIKKTGFKRSLLDESMHFHFLDETDPDNLPIGTIHSVKGKTFESVLLVLGGKNHAEILSIKDFKNVGELPSEKQRMLYVGMSRPESLLCLALPSTVSDNEIVEIFKEVTIHSLR
jgi:DNA helicase-2/ATP-dependent DNA helicase PcrA